MTFLNLSNHPLASWQPDQRTAADALSHGPSADLEGGMPHVPPTASSQEVLELAQAIAKRAMSQNARGAHVAGDFTLTYALVTELERGGVACYAATTERAAVETVHPDGTVTRTSTFRFVAWRRYPGFGDILGS